MSDNIEELKDKLLVWKSTLEKRGLRVNIAKTKIMSSSSQSKKPITKVKWPCGVCRREGKGNIIYMSKM